MSWVGLHGQVQVALSNAAGLLDLDHPKVLAAGWSPSSSLISESQLAVRWLELSLAQVCTPTLGLRVNTNMRDCCAD